MSDRNLILRKKLLRMHQFGWTRARIKENLKISDSRITQLLEAIKKEGIEAYLAPTPRRGKHSETSQARAILEVELEKEPWTLGRWKVAEVNKFLVTRGIELSPSSLHQLLYRMGYRVRWIKDERFRVKESA